MYGGRGDVVVDHLYSVDTEGQTIIIWASLLGKLALQWGGAFNHMAASNMSIKTYAELGSCVLSNCKQMLYRAHMSPHSLLKQKVFLSFPLLSVPAHFCLSSGSLTPLCACTQNRQLLLNWALHSSAVKWCKYRLPWGRHDTQGVCWLGSGTGYVSVRGVAEDPGCVSFTLCPMHNGRLKLKCVSFHVSGWVWSWSGTQG